MASLWKTTIVIYSDYDPRQTEIDDLARDAMTGDSYCTLQDSVYVDNPLDDANYAELGDGGVDFFNLNDEDGEGYGEGFPTGGIVVFEEGNGGYGSDEPDARTLADADDALRILAERDEQTDDAVADMAEWAKQSFDEVTDDFRPHTSADWAGENY